MWKHGYTMEWRDVYYLGRLWSVNRSRRTRLDGGRDRFVLCVSYPSADAGDWPNSPTGYLAGQYGT